MLFFTKNLRSDHTEYAAAPITIKHSSRFIR